MNQDDSKKNPDSQSWGSPDTPSPPEPAAEAAPATADSTAAATPPATPDYEILRLIGHGAYGEVYLARDASGIYRAVKVIFRESFDHERPFEREYEGICKFERVSRSYDNQVQVFHVGQREEPRRFYYVMELADDQKTGQHINPDTYEPKTLRSELKSSGRLPVKQSVSIGLALARALENLHESGLIHRDIKPANIIFVNGRPKLADIGLVTDQDISVSFVGTEGFIPPEGPGSPQADIYGLGKVLYEMCTGRDRMDYPELPTDLAELPDREMFLELNEVIRKACQNDPGKRYRSADELLADLNRVYRGQSLRQRRFLRRGLLKVAAVAGTLVLAGGGIALWQALRQEPEMTNESAGTPVIPALREAEETTEPQKPRSVAAPVGLIGWWPGDGSAIDIVGKHDGTPMNGADYAPGLIGEAFRVNGTNQYFSIPHTRDLSFTNGQPFTLETWVFRTGGGLPFHVLGKRDSPYGCWYQLGFDYGSPRVPLNVWLHLVTTDDGTNAISYYDGVPVTSTPARCPGPNSADFQIGSSHSSGFFKGLIDEVRIYNRALGPQEIKTIFQAGTNGMVPPGPEGPLAKGPEMPVVPWRPVGVMAWWPADGDAVDRIRRLAGSLVNGAAFGPGKVGQAFTFDGRSAHIVAPKSPLWSFGSNAFTIELWANFRNANGRHTLIACDEGSGNQNKWIFWHHGGIGLHVNRTNLGGLDFGYSPFSPRLNRWYHLAVTRRSTGYVFFVDGTAVSTNNDSHRLPVVNAPLTIGSAEGGNFFNGSIDEVRIHNRALTPREITTIYRARTNGKLP